MAEHHAVSQDGFLAFWSCLGDLWTKPKDDCSPATRAVALIGLLEALA